MQIKLNLDTEKYKHVPKDKLQEAITSSLQLIPILLEGGK